ncbi:MAG: hypothetical protein EOO77_20180, partial [Oxalobacteraceae bacterium]
MSWKKYFRTVPSTAQHTGSTMMVGSQPGAVRGGDSASTGSASKYASYLPEVYAGHPNRIQRYYQYDDMDRDSDVNAALDTIADFCTQSEEQTENPFTINYMAEANETEVKILKSVMTKWVKMNDFKSKLWFIFRNSIKYGDAFFLRDPETSEWLWLDQFSVLLVKVDEENGKTPEEYVIRGLDYNKQAKFATKGDTSQYGSIMGLNGNSGTARPLGAGSAAGNFSMAGAHVDPRQQKAGQQGQGQTDVAVVDAKNVVHLSLSVGMDVNWPFGASVLEPIFKSFKQKELLEDAIIIYRVQRAPERRIFYIDVGTMPPPRAMAHVAAIKNEIHQRRIPNRTGGGASILDAAYNPLSIMEDFFFAQSSEGRGSKVETLQGGDNLGEIGDLDYFNKKLARGLRIPPSYLGIGEEQAGYNDGKVGAAMIQEYRFNKYCMRLQSLLASVFDKEFKKYVSDNGFNIDTSIFELQFNPPQNFTKYRQIELDVQQIGVYSGIAENKRLSERFKLKRFLNLTEEELLENERLWGEENAAKLKKATGATPAEGSSDTDLGAVGIRS